MSEVFDEIIQKCKAAGLRKTKSLEELLHTMIEKAKPMTLSDLIETDRLADQCDKVTVYRLLQRLTGAGIVRRLGLHERSAYFALLLPGVCQDYLICTQCDSIQTIKTACPVHALQEEIAKSSGYKNLHHELEFFGICPKCA